MEVSRVNLEEHIAAWMLMGSVLHFSGPAGLQQQCYTKIQGQVHIFPSPVLKQNSRAHMYIEAFFGCCMIPLVHAAH